MQMTMAPAKYLKKPYGRVVVPEADGTFRAEIIEFPGCIAVGDTAAEALANLEEVADSWLEATIAKKQHIPEPMENVGFSGKLVVRLPKSLHKKAAYMAARDGVSLNHFIVSSVAQQVGIRSSVFGRFQLLRSNVVAGVLTKTWTVPSSGPRKQQVFVSSSGNQVTPITMSRDLERAYATS